MSIVILTDEKHVGVGIGVDDIYPLTVEEYELVDEVSADVEVE